MNNYQVAMRVLKSKMTHDLTLNSTLREFIGFKIAPIGALMCRTTLV